MHSCTWNFENGQFVMVFIETWWKWPNDALLLKKPSLEFWKCIIVMFQLAHDFTHLAWQWLFLCATYLDSEPFHFASKSVEFLHASLYHGSLENKLTLDLSPCIWKSSVGDTSCCNFISHCQLCIVVPEILKMGNLWWYSLKLGGNDQMTHCFSKNLVWSSGNAL